MTKDRIVSFVSISNLKLGISDSIGQHDNARARGLRQALFHSACLGPFLCLALKAVAPVTRATLGEGPPNPQRTRAARAQSVAAQNLGRPREGLPLVEEAYRIASDHGLTSLAQQIKPFLDSVPAKAASET
jgi:hypothetical protein